MAEINTRLHYKINGVTDEIKCYTTLTEVQNQGIPVRVGGVAGYAKYGPASDANASRGNYKPPGGTAQRILKAAQVPYGEQAYTTPGTYTFTVPAGITKVKVAMCGGGSYRGGTSRFGNYLAATSHDEMTFNVQDATGYKLSFECIKESTWGIGYGWGGPAPGLGTRYYYCSNFNSGAITVSQTEVVTIIVGGKGSSSTGAGGSGFVLVAWGGDIK